MVTFFLGLLGAIFTGISFVLKRIDNLIRKIDELQFSVGKIRENFVRHDVCKERRRDCPCIKEVEDIKDDLKLLKEKL
jgi:hypothetical protein